MGKSKRSLEDFGYKIDRQAQRDRRRLVVDDDVEDKDYPAWKIDQHLRDLNPWKPRSCGDFAAGPPAEFMFMHNRKPGNTPK